MVISRVSPNDLTELLTETPNAPMQIAAVLCLQDPVPDGAVREALADRVVGVPRLRQRLVTPPVGLGRPIWVDDADFALARHLHQRTSASAAEASYALAVAADASVEPLPRDRPLWAVTLITDGTGGCHGLVIVLHHVLADGIGGLAALAQLVDGGPDSPPAPFPVSAPSRTELLRDVVTSRLQALRGLPAAVAATRAGLRELGGGRRRQHEQRAVAPRCSLNRPVGPRRRLATVAVGLEEVISTAHRHGATVNDVVLTAVGGALARALKRRGEPVANFVVSVPVSARAQATSKQLGNQVGVIPVAVPAVGEPVERLRAIANRTHATDQRAGRGASAAVLGAAFRGLARIGAFEWFITHQRLVNTFVTNLRGPQQPLFFLGSKISELLAISPIAGNVTVAFAALSYAGSLNLTLVADHDSWPDLDDLAATLQDQLDELVAA